MRRWLVVFAVVLQLEVFVIPLFVDVVLAGSGLALLFYYQIPVQKDSIKWLDHENMVRRCDKNDRKRERIKKEQPNEINLLVSVA